LSKAAAVKESAADNFLQTGQPMENHHKAVFL